MAMTEKALSACSTGCESKVSAIKGLDPITMAVKAVYREVNLQDAQNGI